MRQKLNVARALLHDPPVLFLDEPTKGMDVLTAETLRRLLREELVQRQPKTVLLTTHDLEEMEALCDRVGILDAAGCARSARPPRSFRRPAPAWFIGWSWPATCPRRARRGETNGLLAELGHLPGVRSVALVTRSAAGLVLDLGLDEARRHRSSAVAGAAGARRARAPLWAQGRWPGDRAQAVPGRKPDSAAAPDDPCRSRHA